jgi:hypothetical protein
MEVNDNLKPRARHPISGLPEIGALSAHVGCSRHAMDQVGKDEIWMKLLRWFACRWPLFVCQHLAAHHRADGSDADASSRP